MATTLGVLLHYVTIAAEEAKVAGTKRDEMEKRLLACLETSGSPLAVGEAVVIGHRLIKRPYSTLPLVISTIENIDPDSAVIE